MKEHSLVSMDKCPPGKKSLHIVPPPVFIKLGNDILQKELKKKKNQGL